MGIMDVLEEEEFSPEEILPEEYEAEETPAPVPENPEEELSAERMNAGAKALRALVRLGAYHWLYPLVYPVQVARRKMNALACMLRAKKERPV